MIAKEMIKDIADSLTISAHVNSVFGESRQVGRKTIIPIAAMGMGFGAGGGEGKGCKEETGPACEGSGGGGGGGGMVKPLAVLEITDEETRLIPVIDYTKVILSSLALAGTATFLITKLIGRMKK